MGVVTKNSWKETRSGLYFNQIDEALIPEQALNREYFKTLQKGLPKDVFPVFYAFGEAPSIFKTYAFAVGFEFLFELFRRDSCVFPELAAERLADAFPGAAVFYWNYGTETGYLSEVTLAVVMPLENLDEYLDVAAAAVEIVRERVPETEARIKARVM